MLNQNFKVMKQKIFTLVFMIALVIMAGSAIAQSTATVPYEGSTYKYAVGGLTNGDTYTFTVNNSLTNPAAAPTVAADVTINGAFSGTVDDASDTVSVTWNVGSEDAGNFYVWITIQDQTTNCYNYRRFSVNPIPNALEFVIAVAAVDSSEYTSATSIATRSDNGPTCAVPDAYNYNSDGGAAGDDGDTYVYFRVQRTNGSSAFGWTTKFSQTNGTSIEESADGASGTWSPYTAGTTVTKAAADNYHYFRVITGVSTSNQTITGTITGSVELTTGLTDGDSPESDAITINAVPTVGTFTTN